MPKRWTTSQIIVTFLCLILAAGSASLWWTATHVDRHGRIPQPAMAIRVPGGFLQGTGMRDGLHCICMRDHLSRTVSFQFERATYLGNAGYHTGTVVSFGGFTFAILTETSDNSDNILWPYAAVVLPYWVLIATFGCAFVYFSGIARFALGCCIRRDSLRELEQQGKPAAKSDK